MNFWVYEEGEIEPFEASPSSIGTFVCKFGKLVSSYRVRDPYLTFGHSIYQIRPDKIFLIPCVWLEHTVDFPKPGYPPGTSTWSRPIGRAEVYIFTLPDGREEWYLPRIQNDKITDKEVEQLKNKQMFLADIGFVWPKLQPLRDGQLPTAIFHSVELEAKYSYEERLWPDVSDSEAALYRPF